MWGCSITGGGYGAVEFHALHRDPLKCDSSGQWGMVHWHSVPSPHPTPYSSGEEGVHVHKLLHILYRRLRLPLPFLIQLLPNIPYQPYEPPLILPGFLPRGDPLVDKSPRLLRYPRVVACRPFVWIWNGTPQLVKDCVRPRNFLTSRQSEREVNPTPKVTNMFPQGGTAQAPHSHEMVKVVHRVLESHVLKDLAIGSQYVVRLV